MNHLFYSHIIRGFLLISPLLTSCTMMSQKCVKYTPFETCRETLQGEVFCRNRNEENASTNTNEEVQIDKAQWEQEKPTRLSIRARDFVEIRSKLQLLEILTCDEEDLKKE